MKNIYLVLMLILLGACSNEPELSEVSVVDKNTVIKNKTELDTWIYKNITKPYGIEVSYRWNKNNVPQGVFNVPAEQTKVKSVIEAVKFLLLETYTLPNLGGEDFMKGKSPIRIYLYGNRNEDKNGVELINDLSLTTVEMKIYNVNQFDPKDESKLYMLARSIHHQFAKRLISLIPYKRDEFYKISSKRYFFGTKDLVNKELYNISSSANKEGFFTHFSRLSSEDDFAEIISANLTNSQTVIQKALLNASIPKSDLPKEKKLADEVFRELTLKNAMVNEYFTKNVGINLKRMQIVSVQRIKAFLNK